MSTVLNKKTTVRENPEVYKHLKILQCAERSENITETERVKTCPS
jgi:hypothetical protein